MANYITRAYHFMKQMSKYVRDWESEDEIQVALRMYAWDVDRTKCVNFEFGSARYVLMADDFVVKWDYDSASLNIGGCEDEIKMYRYAEKCGYAYLLAKITPIFINGRFFYVMPRIEDVGRKDISIFNHTTPQEYKWLDENLNDLHSWNYGYKDGKVKVIDYACYAKPL